MSINTIQTAGTSCCRDLALPVGLLRKTGREWTRRNTSTANERGFTQMRGKPRMDPPSQSLRRGKLRMDTKERFTTETQRPRSETYRGGSRRLLVVLSWSIIRVHSRLRCFFLSVRGLFFARVQQEAQDRDSNSSPPSVWCKSTLVGPRAGSNREIQEVPESVIVCL